MIANIFRKDTSTIISQLRRNIEEYYEKGSKLTDDEVGELRANTASLLFFMSDITFREISTDRVPVESRREKAEADFYLKHYKLALKTPMTSMIAVKKIAKPKITKKSEKINEDESKEANETEDDEVEYKEVKVYMSLSQADNYARKIYKSDPDYIKIKEDCDQIDQDYWTIDRLFRQANEVLNSMGKRNKLA